MAIVRVFGVQDLKIGAFIMFFPAPTEGAACRSMEDLTRQERHPFNLHAEDFNLYELGTFDESTGELRPVELRSICSMASFK